MDYDYQVGDYFAGVLLETFRDQSLARTRVRPLEIFEQSIRVEFPMQLRESHPLRTKFRAGVKVCQKTDRATGKLRGGPYLVAKIDTIELEDEHSPTGQILATPIENMQEEEEYVENNDEIQENTFNALREAAYLVAVDTVDTSETETVTRKRNKAIRSYAIERSEGKCEACDKPAPFIAKNGKPFLEVHHIEPVAKGGADSPENVAAICPNCHSRTEHARDAKKFNEKIRQRIVEKEKSLG